MSSRIVLIILVFALSAFFLAGCADKTPDNPTRPDIPSQGYSEWLNAWQFFSIFFSTSHDPGYMVSQMYTPPGYEGQLGGSRPYPVLYLLSPFRGDERYYFEHGLATVADRLLAEGKIQPMIIVSIDGRSQLGGSFYTNSTQQGRYLSALIYDEEFTVDPFIDPQGAYTGLFQPYRGEWTFKSEAKIPRIDNTYPTIDDPKARAISGVGMGGYGAFMLSIETDMFGSVSAIDAPLDFDGDGNGGFKTLFNEVFPGVWTRIVSTETRTDTIYTVDTSLANPGLSLVVSAAAAFSPHYYDPETDDAFQVVGNGDNASDSVLVIDSVFRSGGDPQLTWAYTAYDSLDLSDYKISYLPKYQIHAPFDSLGNLNPEIWALWMNHNIEDLYVANGNGNAAHFDSMKKLLIKSANPADAEFHYGQQMDAFIAFLNEKGDTNYQVRTFSGNGVLPGAADYYMYDLLEDILIFHSENFGGVPIVNSSATMVSKSPVLNNGSDTTVISATFRHSDGPSVNDFTATFKIRRPDSTEMILVNNQPNGSSGLTITYDGNLTYTASYVYNPAEGAALGLYDLYFEVSDGTNIAIDDYDKNLDELEIVYSK